MPDSTPPKPLARFPAVALAVLLAAVPAAAAFPSHGLPSQVPVPAAPKQFPAPAPATGADASPGTVPMPWDVPFSELALDAPGTPPEAPAPLPTEHGVLVTATTMEAQRAVAASLVGLDAVVVRLYGHFSVLYVKAGTEVVAALQADPRVRNVQANLPEGAELAETVPLIHADDVHAQGYDGSGTAVAILDTGIDRDHPFLAGRLLSEACYSNADGDGGGTSLCPDGSTAQTGAGAADAQTAACLDGSSNLCDHGTHVAGIAAGAAAGVPDAPGDGVAPGAGLVAIQVFTRFDAADDCSPRAAPCVLTFPSDQLLAMDRLLDVQGTLASDIVAANMSLGGGEHASACDDDSRAAAITSLRQANIATVISAGNDGFGASVSAPGCVSDAITVGATDDSDNVAGFSNRGPLLDLFAPGVNVLSSVPDDAWGTKDGTSMAAPHVTGAWAVIRQIYPTADVATVLGWLQDNGVDISYMSGSSTATTPRIDLLASLQPTIAADQDAVTVDEGQTAHNTGTYSDPNGDPVTLGASAGTITDEGSGAWSWSFDAIDGPADSQTVTVTATDSTGFEGSDTFGLTVNNVPPAVTVDPDQVVAILEGDTLSVRVFFTDPGVIDHPYTATVDWGHPDLGTDPATVVLLNDGPPGPDQGMATASKAYGDNGVFTVTVTVTDKDGGTGQAQFDVTVANVDPTAAIDLGGTTLINGVPTFYAEKGEPVAYTGRSDDPGSDDLAFAWAFGDGASAAMTWLADPPLVDPAVSPAYGPRAGVADLQTHTYGKACRYDVSLQATDDDGGASPTDTHPVLIVGNADRGRPSGWWQSEFQHGGAKSFGSAQLECYLSIARFASDVFDEAVPLTTTADAMEAFKIHPSGGATAQHEALVRELLTAWMNFANGAFAYGQKVVDTNGDGTPDQTFGDAVTAAEATYLDPGATSAALNDARQAMLAANKFVDH